jgi:hypothetical protein
MEDKNQSTATEPVQSAVQTPANQGTGTIKTDSQTDDKQGLEQDGSIKNSK